MLPIKALERLTLIDFSPYASAMVYIGGCNFRCPYCHNRDMVDSAKLPDMSLDEIFKFLAKRKKWLDAVVITGGEPTMYKELVPFVESIKSMGYMVKLDTNGTRPEILDKVLPLLDYVAMDIKASKEKYGSASKSDVNMDDVQKSIDLIKEKAKDYEFRTTVVPQFFGLDDAKKIGQWLKGAKRYVLQQYRPGSTLDAEFPKDTYCKESIEEFSGAIRPYFGEVIVRGV